MELKDLYKVDDYRMMAECGQDFTPLMPEVIDAVGEIGAEGEDLGVFEQARGVVPMGTADVVGLMEEEASDSDNTVGGDNQELAGGETVEGDGQEPAGGETVEGDGQEPAEGETVEGDDQEPVE